MSNVADCLMLYIPKPKKWNTILNYINPNDLYKPEEDYGFEQDPHVTLYYGLDSNYVKNNMKFLANLPKPNQFPLTITGLGFFNCDEYDVLYFSIENTSLKRWNGMISRKCTVVPNDYTNYVPHMTIAYLNKGCIEKYLNSFKVSVRTVIPDKFVFSRSTGEKYFWK